MLERIDQAGKDVFQTNAASLFEDCFSLLLSQGAKAENFKLLKQLQAVSLEDSGNQEALAILFDVVVNICAQIFKTGIRGAEELQLVLNDIGLTSRTEAATQV